MEHVFIFSFFSVCSCDQDRGPVFLISVDFWKQFLFSFVCIGPGSSIAFFAQPSINLYTQPKWRKQTKKGEVDSRVEQQKSRNSFSKGFSTQTKVNIGHTILLKKGMTILLKKLFNNNLEIQRQAPLAGLHGVRLIFLPNNNIL